MDRDRAKDIEDRIAELKRRWPAHSVPPQMWQELEELESELEQLQKTSEQLVREETGGEDTDGG